MVINMEKIADKELYGDYTEAGTGQRLVAMFKDVLKWCMDTGNWYEYPRDVETGLWRKVDESRLYHYVLAIGRAIKADAESRLQDIYDAEGKAVRLDRTNALKYSKQLEKLSHVKASIAFARSDFVCMQGDFDSNPQYLGMPDNKVINLLTGEVEEGKPEYMLTKKLNGNLKENVSDNFITFINRFLPNEAERRYFWLYCGSSLLGHEYRDGDDKCGMFIDSVSGTGKTTFLNVLTPAMGDYFKLFDIKLLTQEVKDPNKPNPLLCNLVGARIIACSEIGAGTQFVGNTYKMYTGNDDLVTRNMFGKTFTFTPDFRILVMCNDLPRPDSTDDTSFRCRFRRIHRDTAIPDEVRDTKIKQKAKTQEWRDDMVTWLIQGAQEYLKIDGKLDNYDGKNLNECDLPDTIKRAIEEYIGDNDTMLDFFTANFKRDKNGKVAWQDIYDTYINYTHERVDYYNFLRVYKKAINRFGFKTKRAWMRRPSPTDPDITEPKYLECVIGVRAINEKDSANDFIGKLKIVQQDNKTNVS